MPLGIIANGVKQFRLTDGPLVETVMPKDVCLFKALRRQLRARHISPRYAKASRYCRSSLSGELGSMIYLSISYSAVALLANRSINSCKSYEEAEGASRISLAALSSRVMEPRRTRLENIEKICGSTTVLRRHRNHHRHHGRILPWMNEQGHENCMNVSPALCNTSI